ncbi:MAG: AAA family ATPase [Thermoleophilia bacterium]|nr:AAA family ATPase [Thermoleophilia bacterium]
MTYVRYLVVSGFKGFQDWNLLDLSPRVSVVVGDNGTGKSSVVEALLWCLGADLGELRVAHRREIVFQPPSDGYSRIRSESEQHLLFLTTRSGRQTLQQSKEFEGGAEEAVVHLVLDDETAAGGEAQPGDGCCCKPSRQGRHDVPSGLVTVTRRLDQDGAETLLLDGQPASAEEVAQALSPHGLGHAQLSVIRQGELERVLVADPVLRAAILARAAGIAPATPAHGATTRPASNDARSEPADLPLAALRARLVRACLAA